ncbi:DUF2147 domain-containing protein [Siphonobacter sp. SORGH_AS_1065]|uniref:DUF2147 domain-containing protein n=1 Tax=Siphonobacter sp. SORGH_AS_1065 TaxID=3041795 RepID=UPI0027838E88|nr:DUF2147 domain-containing protein [Siphonobacter sp. SORGH_AS_1065]MDQ1088924.1 uncharacterized protein (DUF2147 family) [Siphonobacter sp. SORGH_AS_1065]
MRFLLSFVFLFTTAISSWASDIQGTWFNEEKTSKIQIYKQGDRYYGKIVWVKEVKANQPKTDVNNPDEKLRNKPLMGLVILSNFKQSDDKVWEDGKIYDPRNGKTYSCKITKVSDQELAIRGYIGTPLLGRTSKFTKAD